MARLIVFGSPTHSRTQLGRRFWYFFLNSRACFGCSSEFWHGSERQVLDCSLPLFGPTVCCCLDQVRLSNLIRSRPVRGRFLGALHIHSFFPSVHFSTAVRSTERKLIHTHDETIDRESLRAATSCMTDKPDSGVRGWGRRTKTLAPVCETF